MEQRDIQETAWTIDYQLTNDWASKMSQMTAGSSTLLNEFVLVTSHDACRLQSGNMMLPHFKLLSFISSDCVLNQNVVGVGSIKG